MIIGIAGKINSGKDTVADMIQHITGLNTNISFNKWRTSKYNSKVCNSWETVRFADTLKDIVCLILGCTRKQLEDREFKEKPLGEKWIRYGYADGFFQSNGKTTMNHKSCSKERYEEELKINWQTAYKLELTPRLILQLMGTECGRNIIHNDIWVNSTMSRYKEEYKNNPFYDNKGIYDVIEEDEILHPPMYPKWIIPDVRFPNEFDAVKQNNGIMLRVKRDNESDKYKVVDDNNKVINPIEHPSETALDGYKFDFDIPNNGTLNDLYDTVKIILKQINVI